MGNLTIIAQPSIVQSPLRYSSDLKAGEVLLACSPCYIAADELVYQTVSVPDTTAAVFDGMCVDLKAIGDAVTLLGPGAVLDAVAATLTPGDVFYPSDTKGLISDAEVGGTAATGPILKAVTSGQLIVLRQSLP